MPDWVIPILTIVGGVLGPLITVQILLHRNNVGTLATISKQVNHMDECIDGLKIMVARATDHGARITRMEDRIFRVESKTS